MASQISPLEMKRCSLVFLVALIPHQLVLSSEILPGLGSYLSSVLRVSDDAVYQDTGCSTKGAVILFAASAGPLSTRATTLKIWTTLTRSIKDCRPLLAVSLSPEIGDSIHDTPWSLAAEDTAEAPQCPGGQSRVLRASVPSAQAFLTELLPGVAHLVVALDPWAHDLAASPLDVVKALARPLASGAALVLLRFAHVAKPTTAPFFCSSTSASSSSSQPYSSSVSAATMAAVAVAALPLTSLPPHLQVSAPAYYSMAESVSPSSSSSSSSSSPSRTVEVAFVGLRAVGATPKTSSDFFVLGDGDCIGGADDVEDDEDDAGGEHESAKPALSSSSCCRTAASMRLQVFFFGVPVPALPSHDADDDDDSESSHGRRHRRRHFLAHSGSRLACLLETSAGVTRDGSAIATAAALHRHRHLRVGDNDDDDKAGDHELNSLLAWPPAPPTSSSSSPTKAWSRSLFQPPEARVVAVVLPSSSLPPPSSPPSSSPPANSTSHAAVAATVVWSFSERDRHAWSFKALAAGAEQTNFDLGSGSFFKYFNTVNTPLVTLGVPLTSRRVLDVGTGAGATMHAWRARTREHRRQERTTERRRKEKEALADDGRVDGHSEKEEEQRKRQDEDEEEVVDEEEEVVDGMEGDELAASVAAQRGGPRDRVWQGAIERELDNVPDGWYDTIVVADVLEHLIEPDVVLRALRDKLVRPAEPSSSPHALAWPHPLVVVSIPNLGYWPESVRKILDGSWDYADNGVLDRTHLRWFTQHSFERLAAHCGFKVVYSYTLGNDEHEEPLFTQDEAFQSLPRDMRVGLSARQFVFWLSPTESKKDGIADDDNDDQPNGGGNDGHEEEGDDGVEDETLSLPRDSSSSSSRSSSQKRGRTARSSALVAVAVVTSSPVQETRLPQVAQAWAAWDFRAALGLPSSSSLSYRHYEPFYVVGVSDVETNCPTPPPTVKSVAAAPCLATRACLQCSAGKEGLPCKTMCAFKLLFREAPRARWYLRLMDDTLVFPLNLFRALNELDHTRPLYVGDMAFLEVPTVNHDHDDEAAAVAVVAVAFGGCGWGVSTPALEWALKHTFLWDQILANASDPRDPRPGESPATRRLRLDSVVADDVYWGLFMASLPPLPAIPAALDLPSGGAHPTPTPSSTPPSSPVLRKVEALSLPGWSQAPVDFAAGIEVCPFPGGAGGSSGGADGGGGGEGTLPKAAVTAAPVGARAALKAAKECAGTGGENTMVRLHDLGHFHPDPRHRAVAYGACRSGSGGPPPGHRRSLVELPSVYHMGDEVGALSEPWRRQLLKAGAFSAGAHRALADLHHHRGVSHRQPHRSGGNSTSTSSSSSSSSSSTVPLGVSADLGLRAYFEGGPHRWYWRLCADFLPPPPPPPSSSSTPSSASSSSPSPLGGVNYSHSGARSDGESISAVRDWGTQTLESRQPRALLQPTALRTINRRPLAAGPSLDLSSSSSSSDSIEASSTIGAFQHKHPLLLPGPTAEELSAEARRGQEGGGGGGGGLAFLRQAVEVDGVAAHLEVTLCRTARESALRTCHALGLLDISTDAPPPPPEADAAAYSGGGDEDNGRDGGGPPSTHSSPPPPGWWWRAQPCLGVCADLEKLAERLRDHARLHTRPAAVPVVLATDSPVPQVLEVTCAVGDNPRRSAEAFVRDHGVQDDAEGSAVNAIAELLAEGLLPFAFQAMCGG